MWRTVASMLVVGMIGLTFTQEASAGRRAWRRQACCCYYTAPAMVQTAPAAMQPAPAAPVKPAYQDIAPPAPPVTPAASAPTPAPAIAQTAATAQNYRSYSYDSPKATPAPAATQQYYYARPSYSQPSSPSVPNMFRADRKFYGLSKMQHE